MYADLREQVRSQSRRAYQLFRRNPSHPGLNLKKVDEEDNVYSVRIGLGYRALGKLDGRDRLVPDWTSSRVRQAC
jgi:hypothetical protein